ncbi:MAG: putative histidine kinase, partial [Deltaproteobacteria bacterium]|nr:putative histidine kinase [Deltaproteobacteria bacterium]
MARSISCWLKSCRNLPRMKDNAEDSLTIRKVFELALSRSNIAITAVDNGEDAIRLAGEISPDLVVADLTLPGKNGYAVASELRAMEKTEKIPVLILSGTMAPLDEARFKASGARGVLFKPFESRELTEKVELLLREGAAVPVPTEPKETATEDERWDFSDILDEVEAEAGKPAALAPVSREELPPGAVLMGGAKTPAAFNEFDVSLDEIEGGRDDFSAEPPPEGFAPTARVEHIEGGITGDSPPPVTDLSPTLDAVEEIEEIENLEDLEVPLPPADLATVETPASLRILPATTQGPVVEEPLQVPPAAAHHVVEEPLQVPPAAAHHIVEETLPLSPPEFPSAPADLSRPMDAALRELFNERAGEIFRAVASEAVEKVMWEMSDRLAAEFSARL